MRIEASIEVRATKKEKTAEQRHEFQRFEVKIFQRLEKAGTDHNAHTAAGHFSRPIILSNIVLMKTTISHPRQKFIKINASINIPLVNIIIPLTINVYFNYEGKFF